MKVWKTPFPWMRERKEDITAACSLWCPQAQDYTRRDLVLGFCRGQKVRTKTEL